MSTIFYKQLAGKKAGDIPLTFLLVEILELMQDSLSGMAAYDALQAAVEWAGLLAPGQVMTDEQATSLLQRIMRSSRAEENPNKPPGKPPSGKRTFASQYLKFYEKLSIAEKCLLAADHDFEVARQLYCVYDKEVSEVIIQSRFNLDFEKMQVQYEGVVFGMGGSFGSKGSDPEGEVVDYAPSPESPDYLSAAQDFVNMQHSYRSKGG